MNLYQTPDRLIDRYLPADYTDCFTREIACRHRVTPEEFFNRTVNRQTGWVAGLMRLRNTLVKPFGLITDGRLHDTVCERNDDELIFGMPDSHLTFHASLWCGACLEGRQVISITTVVRYNNRFGRIYFFFVRPFHRIIMRAMLRRMVRHAGEQ